MEKNLQVINAERKVILKGNFSVETDEGVYSIYYNKNTCTGIYEWIDDETTKQLDHCRVKELTGYSIKELCELMDKQDRWDRDDTYKYKDKEDEESSNVIIRIEELCEYINENSTWCGFRVEDAFTIRMDYQSYYSENPDIRFNNYIKVQETYGSDDEHKVRYVIHKHYGDKKMACKDDYCIAFSIEELVETLECM